MTKKSLFGTGLAIALLALAVVQFIPSPPLVIPAQLPAPERASHRLLNFEGITNFRDLGGYATADGRTLKWGRLYRSGTLTDATREDLTGLQTLGLADLIDFRSASEKAEEPDRLPENPAFRVVEIPVLDDGNQAMVSEVRRRMETGDFDGFDPGAAMIEANRQFADQFTPQYRRFIHTVLDADGAPVLWHCTAGKDRAGFAAAILLRILGVPQETVMQDYMASRAPSLAARDNQLRMLRLFKGRQAADNVAVMMGVEEAWLEAAFARIDSTWGSFDDYVANGLELGPEDIERLRENLLE